MQKYILFLCSMLVAQILVAQNKITVSGSIIDAINKKPLPGVTVKAIHSKTVAISNNNGRYTIALKALPDVLIVTHIGYQDAKIAVDKAAAYLDITLTPAMTQLEDVTINTGYQQLKPNEVNGSYVVIDNKMLNRQTGTNILDRLDGVTSSLLFLKGKNNSGNPQSSTGITIRGLSTINGPLDPLIVVDNFIYDGDINNINPNDVESITILKDAAAASIWGARAGNGVIVITTKKGKFNEKLKVDFNTNMIVTGKPDLYALPQMSSSDYIDAEQYLFNKGYYDSQISSKSYPALSPAVEVLLARRNGEISATDSAQQIDALKKNDSRDAFTKYYYREALTQQYALNLRGGSTKLAWLLSGTYDKSVSNLRAQKNKVNLRFENTYRPVKNLSINAGIYYTNSTGTTGEPDYKSAISINGSRQVPYLPIAGDQGQSIATIHTYRLGYIDTAGGGKLLNWQYYPLDDWKHYVSKTNTEDILANIGAAYHFAFGLDIDFKYQYERQRSVQGLLADTGSFNTRNTINLFSQINRQTGVVTYIVPVGGIYTKSNNDLFSHNFRGQVNFYHTWNGIHYLSAIGGTEIKETGSSSDGTTYYGYSADPLRFTTIDAVHTYPNFITGGTMGLAGNAKLSQTNYRFVSFFSNASYIYKGKYILSGSMRKDGSNIFGANTNDKWKPLWSAGAGWNISEENFYRLSWLPHLKLSATYGVSGNVDLSRTALPVAAAGTDKNTQFPFIRVSTLNNPDLRWERAYQSNFRLEFASSKEILSGSLEYYHKKGTDLYGDAPFDYTAGGNNETIVKNVADMKGSGVDITIHSRNIDREFKWNTGFLLSINKEETTKYYSTYSFPGYALLSGGTTITPVVGKPLYAIMAYKWGGLDGNGNPQGFINEEKSIDYTAISNNAFDNGIAGGSLVYVGSATPTCFGSILNTFSWKGLTASFNITYKYGYYFIRPSLSYSGFFQTGTGNIEYEKRWQQPGDENKTNVPSLTYPANTGRDGFYYASEINVLKGDHIRLQFVNLTYTFMENDKKLPFKGLQVYVNAANLGILWRANKQHIDPDYVGSIPNPKIYTVGLKANF